MRLALIGLATIVATLAADVQASSAEESFFSRRYCMRGGDDDSSGIPDCSFNTWEQCRATAHGLGRYCSENPYWRPEGSSGRDRTPQRRSGRGRDN